MPKNKTFILSDQRLNCYGFIVLTLGIDTVDFENNPVMLYAHGPQSNPDNVIGKWPKIHKVKEQLLGEPEIDQEDDFALKISKKVDKGYINAASIGIDFHSEDVKLDYPGFEGIPVITKCVLKEVSICAIPGNSNALRLFADGKLLEDKTFALSLTTDKTNQSDIETQNQPMKKILLFAAAMGVTLTDASTEEHVLEAVKTLVADRDALKLKLKEFNDKKELELKAEIKTLLDDAQDKKLFLAEKRAHFESLAEKDLAGTKEILKLLTPHKTISEQLNNGGGAGDNGGNTKSPFDGKSFKELMALAGGHTYLSKLKAENKAEHKKLWEASYPNGTYNA